jgi:protein arginine kinase activator
MKCQKCEKPATFHITELTGEEVMALHFCAECAEKYLKPAGETPVTSAGIGDIISKQIKIGQTAEDLARLDQKTCPVCGISFYDFRQSGRLGCPHDYEFFSEELEPLLANIHGETTHKGKRPQREVVNPEHHHQLIRLRREMKDAVDGEDYETASRLRDQIRKIDEEISS